VTPRIGGDSKKTMDHSELQFGMVSKLRCGIEKPTSYEGKIQRGKLDKFPTLVGRIAWSRSISVVR